MKNSLILLALMFSLTGFSQEEITWDPLKTMERKNIVRWNITPFSLFGTSNIVVGYERVIAPHQSVSLNLGRLKFGSGLKLDLSEYNIDAESQSGGYSIALDYRRYIKKRNRGFAPDGLYWGPYIVYYNYGAKFDFTHTEPTTNTKSSASLDANLTVAQLGIELGYQFIIAKRVAVDLILVGPGFGTFAADLNLKGDLNVDEESDLYKEFFEKIVDRVPGFEKLIQDKEASHNGTYRSGSAGLRYVIEIGILF